MANVKVNKINRIVYFITFLIRQIFVRLIFHLVNCPLSELSTLTIVMSDSSSVEQYYDEGWTLNTFKVFE